MVEVLHKVFYRILYLYLGDIPALKSLFFLESLSEFGNLEYFFIQVVLIFFAALITFKIVQVTKINKCLV